MELHEQLRADRLERGWRQDDVADQLGVTIATVSRWETGDRYPEFSNLAALARLFGWDNDTVASFALRLGQDVA